MHNATKPVLQLGNTFSISMDRKLILDQSLIPKVCYANCLWNFETWILSTPRLKSAFAINNFAPRAGPSTLGALFIYELSFWEEAVTALRVTASNRSLISWSNPHGSRCVLPEGQIKEKLLNLFEWTHISHHGFL